MTDSQIISKLRSMQSWTTTEPWKSIADRLEYLLERERLLEKRCQRLQSYSHDLIDVKL